MKRQQARYCKPGKILFVGKKNKWKKEPASIEINFWTSTWKHIMLGLA